MLMEKHSFKNYDINDMEVFIMFIKVYLLLIALLFCVSGLYQFLTGNRCMIFGVMFFYNIPEIFIDLFRCPIY